MIVDKHISFARLIRIIWKKLILISAVVCLSVFILVQFNLFEFAFNRSIPVIFGTAIAIFLGFRTNSAYERWWEARILWGGIINHSFNLGRLSRDLIGVETAEQQSVVRDIFYRQAAWAQTLNRQLKGKPDAKSIQHLLTESEIQSAMGSPDPALYLLAQQGSALRKAFDLEMIDTHQNNLVQQSLNELTTHMGGCNRIKTTNLPSHYTYFTKVFIWIFLVLICFSLPSIPVDKIIIESWQFYTGIPAIIIIGWVLFMVDGIGDYMQSPFTDNRNVIPMDALSRQIEIGLRMMLGEKNLPEPIDPVDGALW